ncbi:MAG: c-type cytochrome, partial [Tunicatimonas sp.]|uniref:c-type cytochrome n=1 Tax=Tunicatimonas sp. TaxID=1940096 RepID=UPI003C708D1C
MNDCCSNFRKSIFLAGFLLPLIFLTFSWSYSSAQDAADSAATATEEAPADAAAAGGDDGSGIPSSPEAIAEGENIFNNNCTVCHAINKQVVGPALAGVEERWDDLGTLVLFIKNSQKVIQGGNEYAVNLYNEYNKTLMPAFSDYSDEQVLNILGYIKAEASAPAQAAETPGGGEPGDPNVGGGSGIPSGYLTAIIVGLIVVLVLILLVLVLIISVLTRFLNQKQDLDDADREIINQKVDVQKVVKSRPFIGLMLFVFLAIAVKLVLDGLFSVGVQQGYQPKQPIAFSHSLHAGQYEIECQYCHTGVMKAKSANIPSANICMNCHQQIKTESPEIQKIYAAIDFDPETQTYGNNKKPIEWVRIHNLPDLAYFNHAQHV